MNSTFEGKNTREIFKKHFSLHYYISCIINETIPFLFAVLVLKRQ